MDVLKLSQFVALLEAQASGDASAVDRIREPDFSIDDGVCVHNIYQQWSGAFSFPGGRIEALQPILSLAKSVQHGSDNAVAMFMRPEWAQLVALRGPVEGDLYKPPAGDPPQLVAAGLHPKRVSIGSRRSIPLAQDDIVQLGGSQVI
jgi:hypothetical protein